MVAAQLQTKYCQECDEDRCTSCLMCTLRYAGMADTLQVSDLEPPQLHTLDTIKWWCFAADLTRS